MLVKFHSRGKGGGSGPVDYLLGKERNREKAKVLRGDPEQIRELIDGLSFARNYTSGVLSFSENNIPEHQKSALMDSFQDTLMAGLDRNQYDILWVEHQDKDRLELNFLIANVELSTNKRLQPYYDKNDRHYVNAWQQVVNDSFGFTDPHDPARKRFNMTAADLPKDRKQAVSLITSSLVNGVNQGAITNRDDVIKELKANGFEIARETKSSISIKDPQGGKNLRLKGALYERSFNGSADVATEIQRAIRDYSESRRDRLAEAKKTFANAHQEKRRANHERYRQHGRDSAGTPDKHNVQRVTGVSSWSDIRERINNRRNNRPTEIQHPVLKKVIQDNDRRKSRASASVEAVIGAARTGVRRSLQANKRLSRANNFAHKLRAKQQRPSIIARRQERSPAIRRNQRNERGFPMRGM